MNIGGVNQNSSNSNQQLEQLKKLSKDFEAIFIDMMLKTMKIGADETLPTTAENSIYQSMYQEALAKQMSDTSSFGIANAIFNALKKQIENIKPPQKIEVKPLKSGNFIQFKLNLPKNIANIVQKASIFYKVPEKLILSVIKAESNFNPNVVSQKGAMGLMQLMPQTAKELGVTNPFDPAQNIMAGTKYLGNLIQNLQSVPIALAAYNAGLGNVKKFGGVPPFKETKEYIQKVISYYEKA